jgi:hypothetical protein
VSPFARLSPLAVLAPVVLACATPPTSPLGQRLPVIQGLLIADSLEHVFTVTWTLERVTPDDRLPEPDPVDAADVSLALRLPDGDLEGLEPIPASPGLFVVRATVKPLDHVRLTGSVAGVPVDVSIQVPGPLTIVIPDTDTTRILAPSGPPESRRFPFAWSALLAGAYFPWRSGSASFRPELTSGEIFFFDPPDTLALTILAVDSASAAFYAAGTFNVPRGNIPGLLGVFGAATSARRVFIWVR